MASRASSVDGDRLYRVEHRSGSGTSVLGHLHDVPSHFTSLDPFLSRLPVMASGEIVLVNERTDEVVARRFLPVMPRQRPGNADER